MECEQCGARRPRTGPCPECGAPAPGTYSSMRQWKDQSRTGKGPAVGGGRGSGADWGGSGSSGAGGRGRGSGTGWRAGRQDDEWDGGERGYDDYEDNRPASRSGGRNRRPAADYEEVDLERALVPAYGGDMMPSGQGGVGLPMTPGMPASDEEERALGIRRPVYIPATGDRRKRKLGSWRVISGVASVMLVCVASCGLAGVFAHNQITGFFKGPVGIHSPTAVVNLAGVPATPVATPGPNKTVTHVVTAQGVDSGLNALNPTSHFLVGQNVYVVVSVRGIPKGQQHTVSIVWYLDGNDIQLADSSKLKQPVSGDSNIFFALNFTSPGTGMARVYFDRPNPDPNGNSDTDPYLGATIKFGVLMPQPTATPGSPSGTPGKTPSPNKTPGTTPSPHSSTGNPPVAWRDNPSFS